MNLLVNDIYNFLLNIRMMKRHMPLSMNVVQYTAPVIIM